LNYARKKVVSMYQKNADSSKAIFRKSKCSALNRAAALYARRRPFKTLTDDDRRAEDGVDIQLAVVQYDLFTQNVPLRILQHKGRTSAHPRGTREVR